MKKYNQLTAVLLTLVMILSCTPVQTAAEGLEDLPGWKSAAGGNRSSQLPGQPVDPPSFTESPGKEPTVFLNPSGDPAEDKAPAEQKDTVDFSNAEKLLHQLRPCADQTLESKEEKAPSADEMAAAEVEKMIGAIGTTILPASEAAITAARTAFENLPETAKPLVKNKAVLESAEAALPVVQQIAALAPVTLEHKDAVKAARTSFENLPEAARAYVGNFSDLQNAEKEIQALWEKLPPAVVDQSPTALEGILYDGTAQELVIGGTVTGGTLVYSTSANGPFTAELPTAVNAGDHVIYFKAQGDEGHKDSEIQDITVNIQKLPINVDVTIADKQYNGKNDAVISSAVLKGVLAGDTVALENGTAVFETTAVQADIPVSFTEFKLTGADAGNYVLTQPSGITGSIVNLFTPAAGKEFTVSPDNTGWICQDLKITAAEGYTLQLTDAANAPAVKEIAGSTEGKDQTITFYVKNAQGEISNAVVITYSLDKIAPSVTGAENGKIYYDGRKITVEDPTLKSVILDNGAVAVTAGKAQISLPQASFKEDHVILAEDEAGNQKEIKFIMLPLTSITDQTAHITESNVRKEDKKILEAHIQEMEKLKKSDTLSAEDQAILDQAIARDRALIARIDSGALEALAEIRFISAYRSESVTSADRGAIQTSLNRMDALLKRGTLPHEEKVQLTAARARAAELLAIIDAAAAMMEDCSNTLESYVTDTVKSSHKSTIQKALKKVDLLLEGKNLTVTERESMEALKVHGKELLQRISDAYNAAHTRAVEKTKHVHKNNVDFGHREDLETARDQLKLALKAYEGNYLDWEIEEIRKDLDRIQAAIRALDRAATAIWKINQLPAVLQAEDNRTMAAIENAKRYYDCLTAHEMYLVGWTRYDKLMDLYESYEHYQVVPMYQEPDSVDVVFQVTGPFKKYIELRMDNAVLEKDKDYTVKGCEEGTEIVLKDEYLKTLGTRRHEIEVDYRDGIAVGSITNRKVSGSWLPRTADGFHVALWIGTLAVSMSTLAPLMYLKKKKMKNI